MFILLAVEGGTIVGGEIGVFDSLFAARDAFEDKHGRTSLEEEAAHRWVLREGTDGPILALIRESVVDDLD